MTIKDFVWLVNSDGRRDMMTEGARWSAKGHGDAHGTVTVEHLRDYYVSGALPELPGKWVSERAAGVIRRVLKTAGLIEYRRCADGKRRWVRTVDGSPVTTPLVAQ